MFGCTTRLTFFFFNDTATTEIYTLSLHDALPIFRRPLLQRRSACHWSEVFGGDHWYPHTPGHTELDRYKRKRKSKPGRSGHCLCERPRYPVHGLYSYLLRRVSVTVFCNVCASKD